MSEFTPLNSDFDPNDPHLIVVEEKKPSFFDRFGAAFTLLVLAILLFLVAFGILFWNENKTVIETLRLSEGSRLVVSLQSDQPDSDNNGQLVHLTGKTNTQDILADELFYMSANAIKMLRIVEMYQWQEQPDPGAGNQSAVNYEKVWSTRPISSSKFKQVQGHNNPPMDLESNEYVAQNVTLGSFILSEGFILQLAGYEDYPLTAEDYAKINPEMAAFKYHQGGFYRGTNPDAPEVGDVRVRYKVLYPGKEVSVIGMQNLDRLETFHTDYSAIKMLTEGAIDADTMLRREVNARDVRMIWWLRFGGWIAMLASVWMALYSFGVLRNVF
ncbi:MAG: hypothetical protein EBV03_06105, partial [Proteobacteria bacterium]|nr:hypothetical protein [Pseudomonadota bacterium]